MTTQKLHDLLKKSLLEIQQLRGALTEARAATREPIAIVGMACRTPGGGADPEAYWSLLDQGRDAVRPLPGRFEPESIYDPNPDALGKTYVREAGTLDDIDRFDADFFGIPPREAAAMDPQQRLTLEATWEALERAGIVPTSLCDSRTGVYVGAMRSDYGGADPSLEGLDGYRGTGVANSVLAGRVSYVLGLQGPAIAVDTACSSSLVALHLACSGLRHGECDLALAGGVMVMCTPNVFVEFSRLRASSSDGRCKAFSADADGAGWSEGCGMLVLKRLSDAQRDGNPVLAVIRGSAVNQDGRSQGLTAPNGPSQSRLIRRALELSQLAPSDIDAVEAHGTGTRLGDPIEAGALAEVFAVDRPGNRPLWLGSAKSNLGHTQAAAGVLGVIKMVLALRHERLPRTLHAETASPVIDWQRSGLALLQQSQPWHRSPDRARRAGISSFGIGGTNAHLILEEAPLDTEDSAATPTLDLPLLLSARSPQALRLQAKHWSSWLRTNADHDWNHVTSAAAVHRTHFEYRACVAAGSAEKAAEALDALAQDQPHTAVVQGRARDREGVVFVFSGQGGQWPGMARALMSQSAAFADAIQQCDDALRPHVSFSLATALREANEALLSRVEVLQPALFAVGVALTRVWQSLGVQPAAVVGHSVGEIAAAVASNALSLQNAAKLVAVRGRLIASLETAGGMLHVQRPCEDVETWLPQRPGLSVAVVNDRDSTIVSGDAVAIADLDRYLQSEGVYCRRVNVEFAAHSSHMDGLLDAFRRELTDLQPQAGSVDFYSSLAGGKVDTRALDAGYWCRNLREEVRFDRAAAELAAAGYDTFVEISAHPVLGTSLATLCESSACVVGSLERDAGSLGAILSNLAALHVQGAQADWARHTGSCPPIHSLPTYSFDRKRYWLPPRSSGSAAGADGGQHPLLETVLPLADRGAHIATARASQEYATWLADHAVFETVLMPGTGLLDLVVEVGRRLDAPHLRELDFDSPMVFAEPDEVRSIQIFVDAPDAAGVRCFRLHSRRESGGEQSWERHATGTLSPEASSSRNEGCTAHSPGELIDLAAFYARMISDGYGYGPAFRGLTRCERGDQWATGTVELPDSVPPERYSLHPALLDAALHTWLAAGLLPQTASDGMWLPAAWRDVQVHPTTCRELQVQLRTPSAETTARPTARVTLEDDEGNVVFGGTLELSFVASERFEALFGAAARNLYHVTREAVDLAPAPPGAAIAWHGPSSRLAFMVDASIAGSATRPSCKSTLAVLAFDCTETWTEEAGIGPVHTVLDRVREALQPILENDRADGLPIVCVTTHGPDATSRLCSAAVGGLLRSVRNEVPGQALRWVEVDEDSGQRSDLLRQALHAAYEPELRLEGGVPYAPRLRRPTSRRRDVAQEAPAGEQTVLITGALGVLGRRLAHHLVMVRGVRHLVLTSRQGNHAPDAQKLRTSLEEQGASTVAIEACDVSRRGELQRVLERIPDSRPLRAVYHLAGVVEDGLFRDLSTERLARVLAPKVSAAWHLHELTQSLPLEEFCLFSSAAGVLGNPGQSPYAAANAFLDALAQHRRDIGLPGQSLAWGLWDSERSGATSALTTADIERLARQGVAPLSFHEGLALLDASSTRPEPALVPVKLDPEAFFAAPDAAHGLPALFKGLWGPLGRPTHGTPAIDRTLTGDELREAIEQELRNQTTRVLHHEGDIDPGVPFGQLGMDSLMMVELRRFVEQRLDVTLRTTALFNYPSITALASHLAEALEARRAEPGSPPTQAVTRASPPIGEATVEEDALLELARELDELALTGESR